MAACDENIRVVIIMNLARFKRKFKASPFTLVFIAILIFIVQVFLVESLRSEVTCSCKDDSSMERENLLLKSVLKKHKIEEKEYNDGSLPVIYAITPTYARPEQKAELVRLKNTFLHVPSFHWIVVEDAIEKTPLVTNFLKESNLKYTHLFIPTPPEWKLKVDDPRWRKPRGILQRNKGLSWLRKNTFPSEPGVVYFADDDNTYSLELFQEMRWTKKVSIWPVGLVGSSIVERPKVNAEGKVVGWLVGWKPERPFATDMAGFAINLFLIQQTPVKFSQYSKIGRMESDFLQYFVTMDELEPKAELCTKVNVWHTQTVKTKFKNNEGIWQGEKYIYKGIEV